MPRIHYIEPLDGQEQEKQKTNNNNDVDAMLLDIASMALSKAKKYGFKEQEEKLDEYLRRNQNGKV